MFARDPMPHSNSLPTHFFCSRTIGQEVILNLSAQHIEQVCFTGRYAPHLQPNLIAPAQLATKSKEESAASLMADLGCAHASYPCLSAHSRKLVRTLKVR